MDGQQALYAWKQEFARVLDTIDCQVLARIAEHLRSVRRQGHRVFLAGNGGSASSASHAALDFQKAGRSPAKGALRAVSLSDNVGLVTAWANDVSFDRVFAEQLSVLGGKGDCLVVLSVSGSSPNLIEAIDAARSLGMSTVGLLGKDGGKAAGRIDYPLVIPSTDYGWVESVHLAIVHMLTYDLRDE